MTTSGILTFSNPREALALAVAFLDCSPGGACRVARLQDGRFRLQMLDPPADGAVSHLKR